MYNSQLTAFVCTADSGSFNKAAEKLYISSTAVMKQIDALEKHLNLKLLERTRRGVTLTPGHLHPQPLQAIYGPVVSDQQPLLQL